MVVFYAQNISEIVVEVRPRGFRVTIVPIYEREGKPVQYYVNKIQFGKGSAGVLDNYIELHGSMTKNLIATTFSFKVWRGTIEIDEEKGVMTIYK